MEAKRILRSMFRENLNCLKIFLVEIGILGMLPVRAQKKKLEGGYWKLEEGDLYYVRTESLATLSSAVM